MSLRFTVQLNIKSNIYLSGAGLGNTFKVAQLHFHWGRVNSHGSEHYRDSKQYAMEVCNIHNYIHMFLYVYISI